MYLPARPQFLQGHLSMSDDIVKTVEVQPLNLADDAHEKVYARVDQFAAPKKALSNIDKARCQFLK